MPKAQYLVWAVLIAMALVLHANEGRTMDVNDIPMTAPNDEVMAAPSEIDRVARWATSVFGGEEASDPGPPVRLELVRQDYSTLHFGRSCMDTPIKIGERAFKHGLGTHANSEIVVHVPEGAVRFEAFAGIDNNYDTQGTRGSVVFTVEAGGAEVARTPVLRGGDAPYAVSLEIAPGVETLCLKVDTTPDGPSHDQSDWADARFVLADGQSLWLDEGHEAPLLSASVAPFSFVCDGRPSGDLLPGWEHSAERHEGAEHDLIAARWADPDSGLEVQAEVKVYHRFPAADWVLYLANNGSQDSPLLSDIQALDMPLITENVQRPVVLGTNRGDVFGESSFENRDTNLEPGTPFQLAPQGGRSSNGAFPFFDLRYTDHTIVAAIGWSGQWAMSAVRNADGETRVRAGMEHTHLVLRPGERIRTPRILLTVNEADATTAHNRFRRLLLHHYVPQAENRPVALPVASQCFDRYSWTVPAWATEAGQIEAVRTAAELGFDTHWFDAAWFVGGFPNGVGNWFPKPDAFPRGLRPVGDACDEAGVKFILWFEPERVAPGSQIAVEHPEFVHGGKDGGLFRLDDPEARRWLTELLSARIDEASLDVYRNDFNMDPLGHWQGNDAPDRQGMTEIRYVEGLYAMWDELLARHAGLVIDNCASGGRRIDLETCMRSVPLWRSDTNCFPGNADWNPGHSIGISYYVPLHTACAWEAEPYEVRAATTGGLICQWPYRDEDFDREQARRLLVEAKSLQKYWYGDLYPLISNPADPQQWCVFQLRRPDIAEGVALFFRRAKSPYTGLRIGLRALEEEAMYQVTWMPEEGTDITETRRGGELMTGIDVALASGASSMVLRYARLNP